MCELLVIRMQRSSDICKSPGISSSRLTLRILSMSWLSPTLLSLIPEPWRESRRMTAAWNCLSLSRINSSSVAILVWALPNSESRDDLRLSVLIASDVVSSNF